VGTSRGHCARATALGALRRDAEPRIAAKVCAALSVVMAVTTAAGDRAVLDVPGRSVRSASSVLGQLTWAS
jgi:hypothetical protein